MAFYLTGFILLVTMLMGLLTQSYDIFFELALMLPMMYLMYRGYRWIFVFAILWWTFEKGLQLYVAPGSASIASILVWWAVVTYVYFQAYKVEAVRARIFLHKFGVLFCVIFSWHFKFKTLSYSLIS